MLETLPNNFQKVKDSRGKQRERLNLLAYVHLRNIHGSTGAGRVARHMTEHLAMRPDINLHVLADAADHQRIVPLAAQPWNEFRYHFMQGETSRQQAKWFLLNRPCAEGYWPQADLVYCTAESYVPVKKAKLAVTLHDAAYLEDGAHSRNFAFQQQRLKWRLLYAKLARRADMFHTVSHFSAERLAHFYPQIKNRLRVVHNAVAPHFFHAVPLDGVSYLESSGLAGKPFILVPGGLHFRKNADLILQAWPLLHQLHPGLVLAIVNHSDPFYSEKALSLGGSVRLLGFVPDHALRALYSSAHLVWFPSRYEGFGLPVIEAMACGAAVVASDSSSLPEIAGNAALLASPTNPSDHVDAVDCILSKAQLRDEFRARGIARAADFTWTQSAAQLKTCFDQLF
jgi:glycosyltransferase involved in cell wall biosynthesis